MSDEYVKSEKIIETRWKCPTCEQVNRGRDMKCPNCGAPKDESAVYEVALDAAEVTDAEQVADALAGAHWVCAFCEKENRGRKNLCQFCGADQRRAPKAKAGGPPELPKKKPNLLLGCGILLAGLVAIVVFLYWLGSPTKVEAQVASMAWEQSLHLAVRTVVAKEGWQDEVPAGAFNQRCERKQRTTRQVVDHYRTVTKTRRVKYQSGSHESCKTVTEDLGNGYAKQKQVCHDVPEYDYRNESYTDQDPVYRTEPVFDQQCRFDVHEWPVTETASKQGTGASGLAWPAESELKKVSGTCAPCDTAKASGTAERCCYREGRYRVTFVDPEKPAEKLVYEATSPEEFGSFAVGQARALEVDDGKVSLAKTE